MGEHAQDAFDAELEARVDNPVAWIRRTPLYRALVDGLPTNDIGLARLAARAKHYNTCAVRRAPEDARVDCTCPSREDDVAPDLQP